MVRVGETPPSTTVLNDLLSANKGAVDFGSLPGLRLLVHCTLILAHLGKVLLTEVGYKNSHSGR